MIIKYIKSNYKLNDEIGSEDILNEYKEFFLKEYLTINEINLLQKSIINDKINNNIYNSILYYIDKFFLKYLISMTNIDKKYLNTIENKNFCNFYIGVSDDGNITGIPINVNLIDNLMIDIKDKIENYYNDLIGLHITKNKGVKMFIGNDIYYNYDKILTILKEYTKIEIIEINLNNNKNHICEEYINYINNILIEEKIYLSKLYDYKDLIKKKTVYNDSYTGPFYKLIRNKLIMSKFREYCSLDNNIFDNIIKLLKEKIIIQSDVNNYLKNGQYIPYSIYPNDLDKDNILSSNINIFLEEYNDFKKIELQYNIKTNKFKERNPKRKLKSILNNISCFNEYLYNNKNIVYIIIKISWIFVKDKNLYIGYNDNNNIKIIERTYEPDLKMPCTITI